jgi:type II secretion system protein C
VGAACAGLGFVSFWITGFEPSQWFASRQDDTPKPVITLPPGEKPAAPDGTAPAVDTAIAFPGIDSSISETPQRLILTGTIVGQSPRDGTAFIGVNERNPQTYASGALLANGARLTEIHVDFVVLQREGRSVRLYSQKAEGGGRRAAVVDDLLTVRAPSYSMPASATSTEVLTDFIRPNPVYDGEVLAGYEVSPGTKRGVFTQLGLQPGDVITAISDAPLNEPQQAIETLRRLTSGATLIATVQRKGKFERITLDGSLIVADLDQARNPALAPMPPGSVPAM